MRRLRSQIGSWSIRAGFAARLEQADRQLVGSRGFAARSTSEQPQQQADRQQHDVDHEHNEPHHEQ